MSSRPPPRIPPSLAPRDEALTPEPEAPLEAAPTRPPRRVWLRIRRVLFWLLLALFLLSLVPPGVVLALRWKTPPTTAFMLQSQTPVQYHWVPADQIPETLRLAVIAAEDQKFRTHWGFDFIAIAEALEHNETSRKKRGASTITQQTAKNLFLWPSRSWLRKGLEVTFTLLLEGLWTKERILEVYLNIAEFGPGIYGAEAAAQSFFGRPAKDMTPVESARLAAVLPNPRKWSAARPGRYVQTRVDWILANIGYGPPPVEAVEGEEPLEPELAEPEFTEPEFTEPAPTEPEPDAVGQTRDQPVEPTPAPETAPTPETEAPPAAATAPGEPPPPP